MPTYEYSCTSCEHLWEQDQSIKDKPLKSCPKCKKKTAKRLISGGCGFILTGGGWGKDLYSKNK
jgi:putative FmdB family regulatory protein